MLTIKEVVCIFDPLLWIDSRFRFICRWGSIVTHYSLKCLWQWNRLIFYDSKMNANGSAISSSWYIRLLERTFWEKLGEKNHCLSFGSLEYQLFVIISTILKIVSQFWDHRGGPRFLTNTYLRFHECESKRIGDIEDLVVFQFFVLSVLREFRILWHKLGCMF